MEKPTQENNEPNYEETSCRVTGALKQCGELIDHFAWKANQSKKLFERLRYSTIVLTVGVATIAAVPQVPRWVVAIFSGIAALCATLITAMRPQELWLQSRSAQHHLTAERFLFLQQAGDYFCVDEDVRVRLFAKRIIDIWGSAHARWEQGRNQASNQPVEGEGKVN